MEDDGILEKMRLRVRDLAESLGLKQFMDPDALFAHIVEFLPVGVNIYDEEGNLVYINKAQAELVGFDRKDMFGRKTTSLILSNEVGVLKEQLENRKKGISSTYELFLTKKGGGHVRALAAGRPLMNEKGEYRGGFAILSDLSPVLDLENALKKKEESFEQLVRHAPAGILELDVRANRFISVNDVACQLTGYSREELLSMPSVNLFASGDKEIHIKRMADVASGKPVAVNWEYRIRKKDGSLLWALINMSIGYEDGVPAYSRVVATDITEQKLVQQLAIIQRDLAVLMGRAGDLNEVFQKLLESVREIEEVDCGGVYLVDPDSGHLKMVANQGLSAHFVKAVSSFSPDTPQYRAVMCGELIYNNYDLLRSPENILRISEGLKSLVVVPLQNEGKVVGSLNVGSHKHASIPASVRDALASIAALLGSFIGRMRAEKERGQAEEKYRTLVENATDAICIVQDGVIKFPNPVALSLTGYSKKEILGMSFLDLLHPEDRAKAYVRHQNRLSGKIAGKAHDYRFIKKSGETALAQVSGGPITWEGHPAVLMVARDITEHKRMEEQLSHAERMEAVGTLAGGVAHDFNNLLMAIQGNISLMLLSLPEDNPIVPRLKSIESCVQSGTRLTNQLLGYARGGKYSVEPTDLNALAKNAAQLFGRAKAEIGLVMDLAPDLWNVEVDRIQLEQVLLNLFVNAWHAMPGGGEIKLSTANVVLSEEYSGGFGLAPGFYVRLSVTDNGVGMDETVKKRIFEPFFTTRKKGDGVGLGLASSYAIIKNHKGVIHVFSEPQKGSTFSIYIPATDKDVNGKADLKQSLYRGEGLVLLVDDDPMILDVASSMLVEMGFEVITALGGRPAIEIFKKRAPETVLVILDIVMPDMGGRDTFNGLRAIKPDVKVLVASGYSDSSQTKEIMASSGVEFLQKPFDMVELSAKLRSMLS